MLKFYSALIFLLFSFQISFGQMIVGGDTLVGNEWIDYDQKYYKFKVDQDGVYRISTSVLEAAGIAGNDIVGGQLRIYNKGNQVPLYVSTQGVFSTNDYVEFYGYKNRGELDKFLFANPDIDMLNPDHSMYTDQNVYYLSTTGQDAPVRVINLINDVTNPPAQEEYYLHREYIHFTAEPLDPYYPLDEGGAISYSSYLHSEGFAKLNEVHSTTQIPALNRFLSGPDAKLRVRFASTNHSPHSFIIAFNGVNMDTIELVKQQIFDKTYSIPVSALTDDNQFKIIAENTTSRHSLVSIELVYPHTQQVSSLPVASILLEGQTGDQYHVLTGFPLQGQSPVIYTYDGKNRMVGSIIGINNVAFKWRSTLENVRIEITDPVAGIRSISSLEEKTFVDFSGDDTEYIVITHPELMPSGTESEYVQYRMTPAGGGYRAKAYSILDLYDQFGYGVEKHPQAIRNFVEFFDREWPSAKMIFIVGRAIEYYRSRYPGAWEEAFFVPTFGRPGSDNLLAATLTDLVPRFPIGRLAVVDAQTIDFYLDKAKEHDASKNAGQSLEEKAWIKNVIHIAGGKTAGEQDDFKSDLNSMATLLEQSDYGARVHFFQKESTDIIGESQSAQIEKLLHEGTSIINYLGHSAASTFEFNIIDPSVWDNAGHYPVFSAMGCSAGQIHGTLFSLSDRYVQIPNEGSIAFISGSGSQFASALVNWGTPWYDFIGNVGYGRTLGESVQYGLEAINSFINVDPPNFNHYRFLLEQQTFQGDPALRMHPLPGPDYLPERSTVSIKPEILDTKLDSFDLQFSIFNIGRNLRQDVEYKISIKLPNGQEVAVNQGTVLANTFESVVNVRLPLLTDGKPGVFRLLIHVDPQNLLNELPAPDAELNNHLIDNFGVQGIEIIVIDNIISAVYPPDFAIVTKTLPELVATSSNSFVKNQDIVIEIDTTALFNSPAKLSEKFIDHSAVLKWTPGYSFTPDVVYYWRVSADSISPEQGFLWSSRSFVYKPGYQNGWNQSHFYQFTDNQLEHLQSDSSNFDFRFQRRVKNFRMVNRFHDVNLGLVPLFFEDGKFNAKLTSTFRNKEVHGFVVAIDSTTGKYMYNTTEGLYGSVPHTAPMEGFAYNLIEPESRQAMINLIENVIPSGYYVFFYTYQHTGYEDYQPEEWASDEATFGKSIFTAIESQVPFSSIRTLEQTGSKPYIVLFQKDRGVIDEQIATNIDDVISISFDGGASFTDGRFISEIVGPSSKWYSIENQIISHNDTTGSNTLSAFALNEARTDTLWISQDIAEQEISIEHVNADLYPYIQLVLETVDSSTYNPADIEYWRVLYDGYPEFIINPDAGFVFIADTLFQGETMKLSTFIENVSDYSADSIPVSLRLISTDNTTVQLSSFSGSLAPHSTTPISFEKSTASLAGDYQVLLEINSGRAVKETEYGNNIGILPMHVREDDTNPILDVTFDGVHILDGDLVAGRPVIVIKLHDENQYLRLEDTSSFEMYLQFPSEFQPRRIYFSESWVKFIPPTANQKNVAYVELTPVLHEDGTYKLQVKAKDASGNVSGDNDYVISFEVINEESISHIYNYPNPFSTSTRFVYTMTGASTPPFYKIQIMSISGRIVKEISHDELGPLKVGTHMTDYVWDGTDENGDRLAAGTYLYRIIVKNNDLEDYERYETSGDSFFKNGWGKLVIIR